MIHFRYIGFLLFFACFGVSFVHGQSARISGKVTNSAGEPMLGATLIISQTNFGTISKDDGSFLIENLPTGKFFLQCTFLGYKSIIDSINLVAGKTLIIDLILQEETSELESVTVTGIQQRENTLMRINMKSIDQIPNTSGNIETVIKTMSGVVSGNEMSSQYSVRGGSFDENLVYVNDVEIYRPLLVQSAMQEGLSFVHPNMVGSLQFSAGAFAAEYGDKMASVLDVNYKRPTDFEGNVYASLLGGGIQLAGADKSKKLTVNAGIRYKTTNYLLNSLDIEGEYQPRFTDFQTLIQYNFSPKSSISFLGNYASNQFALQPISRSTDFGTLTQTLNFTVFYEGQEYDRFDSYQGALNYTYTPNSRLVLKLVSSLFSTAEQVNYDILSEYWLNQISSGASNRDTVINIGTGASLEHARNKLKGNVSTLEHKGLYTFNNASLKWGLSMQQESFDNRLSEWRLIDSAGYSLPYSESELLLDYSYKAQHSIFSYRYKAFVQHTYEFFTNLARIELSYGVRANYSTLNKEFLLSPRASIGLTPDWEQKVNFYFATGIYSQPPLFKELTNYKGELFLDAKAQKSAHFVLGTDYHYQAWGRPFIFTSEVFYKNFYQLTPYKIENVQVKYLPEYRAKGYAAGLDLRVNGEFVPGVESWFSLSLLQTREDTYQDSYQLSDGIVIYPSYYRRPSDQFFTFSVFFQDYLPSNPNYKLHLLVNYGSGLPYSGPTPDRPSEYYMLSSYRRVDVGFSRNIKRQKQTQVGLHDIWIGIEILNLLDASNMASYDWVKTVENNEGRQDSFAVPNYLTGRRLNIKISSKL